MPRGMAVFLSTVSNIYCCFLLSVTFDTDCLSVDLFSRTLSCWGNLSQAKWLGTTGLFLEQLEELRLERWVVPELGRVVHLVPTPWPCPVSDRRSCRRNCLSRRSRRLEAALTLSTSTINS